MEKSSTWAPITKTTSRYTETDSLSPCGQSSPEHTDAGRKGTFCFRWSLLFFQITVQAEGRFGSPNLVGCVLWAGFG
jgi:hypothetical protein